MIFCNHQVIQTGNAYFEGGHPKDSSILQYEHLDMFSQRNEVGSRCGSSPASILVELLENEFKRRSVCL